MAKLTENTVVNHPDGVPRALLKGEEIPAWATSQIGKHLLPSDEEDAEPTPYREQRLADLRAEVERRNAEPDRDASDRVLPEGRASIESFAVALDADDDRQKAASGGDGTPGGSGG